MTIHSKPIAVVAGSDHQNTLGLIRSLGEEGFCVKAVIISHGGSCATAHSKYIDELIVVRPEEIVSALVKLGKQVGHMVPLIPGGDDTAVPIAKAYDQLKELYNLSGANAGGEALPCR